MNYVFDKFYITVNISMATGVVCATVNNSMATGVVCITVTISMAMLLFTVVHTTPVAHANIYCYIKLIENVIQM